MLDPSDVTGGREGPALSELQDETAEIPLERPDPGEERQGFFYRWLLPVGFLVAVLAAFWFLAWASLPVLTTDSEMPENHIRAMCGTCHRAEPGLDPMTLLES